MDTLTNIILFTAYIFILFCGIYVISTKNPILSVLYLILLFSIVALYLMQLTASFIGLAYLLVYVGAVSILFLFILMLINIRTSELVTDNNNSIPLSIFIISTFVVMFETLGISNNTNSIINIISGAGFLGVHTSVNELNSITFSKEIENTSIIDIIFNLSSASNTYNIDNNVWDTVITTISHINNIGNTIYISYPLLLLIISIILLLSMIGSIIITVKR